MADKKQLKRLRRSIRSWNDWREHNPKAKINLRGANLKGLDLSYANLSKADVRGTNFSNSILTNSNFAYAKCGIVFYKKTIFTLFSILLAFIFSFFPMITSIMGVVFLSSKNLEGFTNYRGELPTYVLFSIYIFIHILIFITAIVVSYIIVRRGIYSSLSLLIKLPLVVSTAIFIIVLALNILLAYLEYWFGLSTVLLDKIFYYTFLVSFITFFL